MKLEHRDVIWYRCREFVANQSCGEWDIKTIEEDTDKLRVFVGDQIKLAIQIALSATLKPETRET